MPQFVSGTFTAAASTSAVFVQVSPSLIVHSSADIIEVNTSGVSAGSIVKAQRRQYPGGPWEDIEVYTEDQVGTTIPVAPGQEWRIAQVSQAAITDIRYSLSQEASGQQAEKALVVDFGSVHEWPILKSRIGFVLNAINLETEFPAALEMMTEVGPCVVNTTLELDSNYKRPGVEMPYINGDASSMTSTPTAEIIDWVSDVHGIGAVASMSIVGVPPQWQPAYAVDPIRHPVGDDIPAAMTLVNAYMARSHWGEPIDWSIGNEWGRTMHDCDRGEFVNDDGSTYTADETQEEYLIRRMSMKEVSRDDFATMYLTAFSTDLEDIGAYSTASPGPMVAGDQSDSNGRSLPDGSTFRAAWFVKYEDDVLPEPVVPATFFNANNFATRDDKIVNQDVRDFGGLDHMIRFTQSAPRELKGDNNDGGGDGETSAATERMSAVCERTRMLAANAEMPALEAACWAYTVGGQDAFISYEDGETIERHALSGLRMWMGIPTRRVPVYGMQQIVGDDDYYGAQGLLAVAGIEPGGQRAAVLVWNETLDPIDLTLGTMGLHISGDATHSVLSESSPTPVVGSWSSGRINIGPRTLHLLEWGSSSAETRRDPLADGSRTPRFLQRFARYRRPVGASAHIDQVRGVVWMLPSPEFNGNLSAGALWSDMVDTVYVRWWAHNVDNEAATLEVECEYLDDYVSLDTASLLSTTVGDLVNGQIDTLDIAASAPTGWSSGDRQAIIMINMHGSGAQRVEAWLSGTLTKAQALTT